MILSVNVKAIYRKVKINMRNFIFAILCFIIGTIITGTICDSCNWSYWVRFLMVTPWSFLTIHYIMKGVSHE